MKFWSKVRSVWYRLRRKDIRYIYVPTKEFYRHRDYISALTKQSKTQSDLENTNLEGPRRIGDVGIWVVDTQNKVKDALVTIEKDLEHYLKVFPQSPLKERPTPITVRDSLIKAIEEVKNSPPTIN